MWHIKTAARCSGVMRLADSPPTHKHSSRSRQINQCPGLSHGSNISHFLPSQAHVSPSVSLSLVVSVSLWLALCL